MIKGMHGLFFTPEAEEARDFLKDKLGLPFVDGGGGWLIFGIPMAEAAVHPADETRHEISFWCDDIEATVAELRSTEASSSSRRSRRSPGAASSRWRCREASTSCSSSPSIRSPASEAARAGGPPHAGRPE